MSDPIVLRVNGVEHRLDVDPERSLLEVLRDELGLTGTKYGCGEGQCGACTVLLGDAAVRACRVGMATVAGASVRTIEGLAQGERLHPVQAAFLDTCAMQCGYCTAGMIMATVALLERKPTPTRTETLDALHGNLCRCGTYRRVLAAVDKAAAALQSGGRK